MIGRLKQLLASKPLLCGLLALVVLAAAQREERTFRSSAAATPGLRLPKPTPAYRNELPAAFSKKAPETMADLEEMERHVKALVARVSPAVVAVEVGYGTGSGVVISSDGLVLTAGHVCERPGRNVRFIFPDGSQALGRTLGVDEESDTGLMRITDRGHWPFAEIGDLERTRVGDWVLACGHPGGFDPKRSVVVRLGRLIRIGSDAIQSDCTIAPGDSGGPLFDMHGRVIGIHSAISSSVSENFHVPITEFFLTWEQLALGGRSATSGLRALPAHLGATAVPAPTGCRIDSVERHGPAWRAGLKVGDIVLKVDGHEIKAAATFDRWLDEARPGETLRLEILRGEQVLPLRVRLGAEKK